MLNKSLLLILILILIQSCKKNTEKSLLNNKVFSIVDSMSLSFPKEYPVNLYTVTHQKQQGKDYIKVSTSEYFNRDSVSSIELNNQKLIIYYSKDFFKQKEKDIDSYKELEYKDKTISLYHPRYIIFEVLKGNTYRTVSQEEGIEMKLFDFGDRYIPEPEPASSIK